MSREISMTVYKFSELDENAQNRAIDNLSNVNVDYNWWDCDGLLDLTQKEMVDRKINPDEYPSSLYTYDKIYFDIDREWYLEFVNLRVNVDDVFRKFLRITKRLWENVSYDFYNKENERNYTTTIFFTENNPLREFTANQLEALDRAKEIFDNKVHEALVILRDEYKYRTSREAIIETIKANDYEFYGDGTLY